MGARRILRPKRATADSSHMKVEGAAGKTSSCETHVCCFAEMLLLMCECVNMDEHGCSLSL